ncbi:MAG: hypothetical protein KAX49_21015 [Halanaerobiales bacterium]|nr:hypothetical protein [Halanaerobiales bacterium]
MNKKNMIVLCFCRLIVFNIGCSSKLVEDNSKEENLILDNREEISQNDSTSNTPMSISLSEQESINQKNEYFGEWVVIKEVASGLVLAVSDDEIKNLIGKTLIFSKEKAKFGNQIMDNPQYEETYMTNEKFVEWHNLNLLNIDIYEQRVKQVEIYSKNKEYWYSFGGSFYIKDKETLIVYWKGVYMELNRKN